LNFISQLILCMHCQPLQVLGGTTTAWWMFPAIGQPFPPFWLKRSPQAWTISWIFPKFEKNIVCGAVGCTICVWWVFHFTEPNYMIVALCVLKSLLLSVSLAGTTLEQARFGACSLPSICPKVHLRNILAHPCHTTIHVLLCVSPSGNPCTTTVWWLFPANGLSKSTLGKIFWLEKSPSY